MTKRVGVAGLVVAVALGATWAMAQVEVSTVALSKDYSPEEGFWYVRFNRPVVSDAAEQPVSFFARTRGVTSSKKGIFKDGPGRDDLGSTVVLVGDPSPDSRLFKMLSDPTMNAAGHVAFSTGLAGGANGVFRGDQSVVALLGDSVPDVVGFLSWFSHVVITEDEGVIFRATISGAAEVGGVKVDQGIFRCSGGDGNCSSGTGSLEALVLRNDPVPDRPDREICNINEAAASNFGVAFVAESKEDCADGDELTRRGVFRVPFAGSIVTIALEGEACEPYADPGGTTYGLIWALPDIANDGSVVFKARTTGISLSTVLYLCLSSTCPPDPAEAKVITGTVDQDGNVFSRFSLPAVSDAGDMAFKANARGDSGTVTGVYVRRAGATSDYPPETVVLQGDIVPDLVPATEFAQVLAKTSQLDMSPGGKIAFKAKVRRVNPPEVGLEGIFLVDVSGSPSGASLDMDRGVVPSP